MFVNVNVKLPLGVHLKLLLAAMSKEPSLSVVNIPLATLPTDTIPVLACTRKALASVSDSTLKSILAWSSLITVSYTHLTLPTILRV